MLNQARLKVLKVREDHVKSTLDEARKRLSEVARDQGKYAEILKLLITQGLYQVGLIWYSNSCFFISVIIIKFFRFSL